MVALKILRNKKRLYKQGLIEASILQSLKDKDNDDKRNVVRILDSFVFRRHLVLSFEMLSMNLYEFIKLNNFQGVSHLEVPQRKSDCTLRYEAGEHITSQV
jgi:dual specificity tyrosine-phosphorylation-regulated kinase 2/3/4